MPEDCEPTTTWSPVRYAKTSIRSSQAYNLREIQGVVADGVEYQVLRVSLELYILEVAPLLLLTYLQLIDNLQEVLA